MTERKKCANSDLLHLANATQLKMAPGYDTVGDPVVRTFCGYLLLGCPIDEAIERSASPLATKEELQDLVNDALRLAGKPLYSFESLPEEPEAKPQAYYDKALENATQAVRSCHKGNRQNELYRKAFSMGCFCGEGHLDSQIVERELLLAYPGKNAKKALATIRRGLKRGMRHG